MSDPSLSSRESWSVNSRLVPAGRDATNPQPGDLLFLHMHGPVRTMIHIGQWARPTLRPWSRFTHVAVITHQDGTIIEAKWPHVRRVHLTEYRAQDYVHVTTHLDPADQQQAVKYLESCVGDPYGAGAFIGTATRMLTPGRSFVQITGRWPICSGLGATALERGWFIPDGVSAPSMCPAELARAVGAQTL